MMYQPSRAKEINCLDASPWPNRVHENADYVPERQVDLEVIVIEKL